MPLLHHVPRAWAWAWAMLFASGAALSTAAKSPALPKDVTWACQQPEVAHVRLLQVMVQEPQAPCVAIGAAPDHCNVVKARATILDALPMVGASAGLARRLRFNRSVPDELEVLLTSRDGQTVRPLPFEAVNTQGLLALQTVPALTAASEGVLPDGVFIPLQSGIEVDLDQLCRPIRHWSGQKQPPLPEQLPGSFPARTEDVTALARRMAALVRATPPDVASLERAFGSRLLAVRPATDEQADERGLARLQASWVGIQRKTWLSARGLTTRLILSLTPPHAKDRQVPWWDKDRGDTAHTLGNCVTPSMVMKALEEQWPMERRGPPYDLLFENAYPHYKVRIGFMPHLLVSPGPYAQRNLTDQCLDDMSVEFEPR